MQDVGISIPSCGLTLRPSRANRVAGWIMVTFGVLFGLLTGSAGLAAGDIAGALLVVVFGFVMVAAGAALSTATVRVSPSGIRYRYGVSSLEIPSTDIRSIELGPGSSSGPPKVALIVERTAKKRVRLTPLQRWATPSNERAMLRAAEQIRDVLGLKAST